MSVDVPRPRFLRNVLCGTAVLALVTVLWSASAYHGGLRAPHLLMGAYWLALVAIAWRARQRIPVERKLAIVRSPRRAGAIEHDVTLRFENGDEVRHRASRAASARASQGDVGVACLRNGMLTWFEPLDVPRG